MAGRMGNKRVTVKNLLVVNVADNGLLIKGLVPGAKSGLLEIRKKI
jgi:ribosomal protein L3